MFTLDAARVRVVVVTRVVVVLGLRHTRALVVIVDVIVIVIIDSRGWSQSNQSINQSIQFASDAIPNDVRCRVVYRVARSTPNCVCRVCVERAMYDVRAPRRRVTSRSGESSRIHPSMP